MVEDYKSTQYWKNKIKLFDQMEQYSLVNINSSVFPGIEKFKRKLTSNDFTNLFSSFDLMIVELKASPN